MRRTISRLGGVAIGGAAMLAFAVPAQAQLHGFQIAKGCGGPFCVGDEVICDVQFGYNDDFGDTLRIHAAWDVQDVLDDMVRIPAQGAEVIGDTYSDGTMIGNDDGVCDPLEVCEGNLAIVAVSGNTTCSIGGSLPCEIGAGSSTLSGLPGDPDPGTVTFQSAGYFVQPDDVSPLRDQATVLYEDLCDEPNTANCGAGILNAGQAPGATSLLTCDDGDPCTTDTCANSECVFTPDCVTDADCDDGNACSVNTCVDGCCEEAPLVCEDNDVCTDDSCDPATGCVFEDNSSRCDDNDVCTDDSCDPELGCVNEDNSSRCDDGDACTIDSCDPETGCVNEEIVCDDEDPCTSDACVNGICVFTVIEPLPDGCFSPLACRMTGGGVDTSDTRVTRSSKEEGSLAEGQGPQEPGGRNRYTMGGQAGAPTANQPQPYGEWTHHQQRGANGKFVFHAGTASAPRNTEIDEIVCTDPDWCVQARPAPAKQIDFQGVGSFRNADSKAKSSLEDHSGGVEIVPGESLHWFHVHVEDLGEPGRAGKVEPPADTCPPMGSFGMLADCECPDYYEIQIHATSDPASPIIYDVFGYITGGNLQIHPPID